MKGPVTKTLRKQQQQQQQNKGKNKNKLLETQTTNDWAGKHFWTISTQAASVLVQ